MCIRDSPYTIKPRRPGDIATCYCDPSKAKRELGWEAQYGIKAVSYTHLPLPKHIDEDKVIDAIDPKKDVDGFSPQSVGAMVIGCLLYTSMCVYVPGSVW